MQPVLERSSIDKPLTFDVGLIQLSFIPVCSPNTFQSNCAEGLHFSAFHLSSKCITTVQNTNYIPHQAMSKIALSSVFFLQRG